MVNKLMSAALVGVAAVGAGLLTAAPAHAQALAQCENIAHRPTQSVGTVHGLVERRNAWCGNASVVITIYKENGWWDTLVAASEDYFATGSVEASGPHAGNGEYFVEIRVNGETVGQSPHTYLQW
jgi:hypothetical protein